MKEGQVIPPEMKRVAEQIATWRMERERIGPMPEELWRAAVDLAGKYDIGPTSKSLKIDFGGLQRRMKRFAEVHSEGTSDSGSSAIVEKRRASKDGALNFVELSNGRLAVPSATAETTVEVTRADGAAMMVRLHDEGKLDLGGLVESFLRQSR